jgi:hypothetical protein
VHAPHRSSPALTQSPSAPAPRSTPTVPSHHRPSPSRRLPLTQHVTPHSSLSAPHGHSHTTTVHATWHHVTTLSVHTDLLHIQPAPHGHTLSTNSLLLTSHSQHDLLLTDPTTACSSQASPFYCLLLTDRPCYTACSSQAHVHTHTHNFTDSTTSNATSPPTQLPSSSPVSHSTPRLREPLLN